jgi:putative membrane protein
MSEPPRPRGPVLIEVEDAAAVAPEVAPPVPEGPGRPPAMEQAMRVAARPRSRLGAWFW